MQALFWTVLVLVNFLFCGHVNGQLAATVYVTPPLSQVTVSAPARYSLLLRELATITNGRKILETVVTQNRKEYEAIKQKEMADKAACSCYNATAVAFTAHLDKNVATLGVDQPIPFDNVTFNSGNAYDARHAQFRAPVSGTYQFFVTLTTHSSYRISAEVLLNGSRLVKIRTGNDNQFNTATNGFVVHMMAGDDLWVQHDPSAADSNRLFFDEGLLTSFTGYLLYRD